MTTQQEPSNVKAHLPGVKWSVTLSDRLGLEMFTISEIKGQVLHCVLLHLKVPVGLSHLNVLISSTYAVAAIE